MTTYPTSFITYQGFTYSHRTQDCLGEQIITLDVNRRSWDNTLWDVEQNDDGLYRLISDNLDYYIDDAVIISIAEGIT